MSDLKKFTRQQLWKRYKEIGGTQLKYTYSTKEDLMNEILKRRERLDLLIKQRVPGVEITQQALRQRGVKFPGMKEKLLQFNLDDRFLPAPIPGDKFTSTVTVQVNKIRGDEDGKYSLEYSRTASGNTEDQAIINALINLYETVLFADAGYIIKVILIKIDTIEHKKDETPSERVRLFKHFKIYSTKYDNIFSNRCCFDYLMERYNVTEEYIRKVTGVDQGWGMTLEEMRLFAVHKRLTMVALDHNEEIMYTYEPPKRKHRKAIHIMVDNNHIYPCKQNYNRLKNRLKKEWTPKESTKVLTDNLWDRYELECDEGLLNPHNLSLKNGQLISYTDKTGKRISAMDIYTKKPLFEIFEEFNLFSRFNKDAERIFYDCRILAAVEKTVDELPPNAYAIDVNKSRGNLAMYGKYFWCKFTIFDQFVATNEYQGPGFYYCEAPSIFPYYGNNLYPHSFIQEAKKLGLDKLQITHFIKPSETVHPDIVGKKLENLVVEYMNVQKEIREKKNNQSKDDQFKLSTNYLKELTVRFAGYMGKKKTSVTTGRLTNDYFTVQKDFYQRGCDIQRKPIQDQELYLVTKTTETKLFDTGLPIYLAIMALERLQLYEVSLLGNPIAYKTDCVIFSEKPTKEYTLGTRVGQLKEETPRLPKITINPKRLLPPMHVRPKHGSCTIGIAGTGKSTKLRELAETYENKYILAPTNKAACNVYGQTIHRFVKQRKKVDALFIDEISMISKELWYELDTYLRVFPDTHLHLYGDFDQLPPIEELSYKYDPMVYIKTICRDIIHLTTNFRNDVDYTKIGEIKLTKDESISRAICWYNKTRKEFNAKWMPDIGPLFEYKGDNEEFIKYSQPTRLKISDPVIPLFTKKGEWAKNDDFTIISVVPLIVSNDRSGEGFKLKSFDGWIVNHATTIYRSQGSTYHHKYRILDELTPRQYYVALSRCSDINNVFL